VTRLAQVVFGVLVVCTFAAFFVAQQLKSSPSVVQAFKVKYPVVSPNGDGRLDRQRVTFRLKRGDTVDVAIVDDQGDEVRELVSGRRLDAYRQLLPSLAWDGLDDDGRPVPDGAYRARVTLRGEGRSVEKASAEETGSISVFMIVIWWRFVAKTMRQFRFLERQAALQANTAKVMQYCSHFHDRHLSKFELKNGLHLPSAAENEYCGYVLKSKLPPNY